MRTDSKDGGKSGEAQRKREGPAVKKEIWSERECERGGEVRRNEINNERLHNRNLIRTAGPYIAPD